MRALRVPERQRLQLAEQDHHPGGRLRVERHLQLHHTAARALPPEDVAEPDHHSAGTPAGHRVPRRHLVFPAGVLDAGLHRLVSYE